jgi:putative transposase
MPRGLTRYQQTGYSHFVTFTCYHRIRRLQDETTRDLLVAAIEQARKHYDFCVYGFVIMPEHIHLLMSEPKRGLVANAIQSLKIASAKRSRSGGPHLAAAEMSAERNSTAAKCGTPNEPFWQKRYYDRNVRSQKEFVRKLRYTHRNPVTADLVQNPEDWKWSSFRHYLTGEWCGVEIESQWTAREREKRGIVPSLDEE